MDNYRYYMCYGLKEHDMNAIQDQGRLYYWDRPGSKLIVVKDNNGLSMPRTIGKGLGSVSKIVYNR